MAIGDVFNIPSSFGQTYAYDNFNRLSYSVRDGIITLYTYDWAGQQTAVTVKGRDNGEITTGSEYTNGVLTASVDALGNRTTFSRNRSGGTTTETQTNPDGGTQLTTSYLGQTTGVSGTAVHPQSYEYGANWQRTLPQNITAYSDLLGRQYRTVYADNSEAVQYYNSKSQMVKSVTPAERVTLYEYDTLGRQTTQAIDMNANDTIDSADIVTTTAYSYATYGGKTVSVTTTTRSQGADSKVISINRRSLDGLESWSTDIAGLTTHALLERLGSGATRQTVTPPTGVKTVTETQNDRVTKVTTLAANDTVFSEATYTYDQFNRVSSVVEKDSAGNTINTTAMTYNAAGQPLTQTVNGQTTTYAYDVVNRTVTTTQPGNRVIVQESYPTGELKRISGADTYTQEWTWNPTWGQKATLTTWKDANTPQVTTWTYNNRGFNTAKAYADNNGPTYTYDADGNMLTRTWARGITTTYTYDAAGRQTGYSYSDGVTPSVNLTLNYLDHATAITDAAGTRSFTYDSTTYRLTSETDPIIVGLATNYVYDAYGRKTAMNLMNGQTPHAQAAYTYDTVGRIATVGNSGDTLTYSYRPGMTQVASAAWANATALPTMYTYDQYHRLTGIAVNNQSVYGYTLNDKNQRTEATLGNGDTWGYTYDTLGQLTGAVKKDAQDTPLNTMSYVYDLIGNRTAATEDANSFSYTSNVVNQYIQINQSIPTFDIDGNMLTYNGWSFTWNGENRLVIAENTASGMRVEADYDYMGRRFKKKVYENDVLTSHSKFAYDGYKQIAEFDALDSDALLASYLWQPVGLDVPLIRNNDEYYIVDGNKNVIELCDATGAVTDTYAYAPFGKATHVGNSDNPFQFSSEYYDAETELVYYNYRYYSPVLGRWIKRDPITEEGGINLYGIGRNSIPNGFDYLGLCYSVFNRRIDENNRRNKRRSSPDVNSSSACQYCGPDVTKVLANELNLAVRRWTAQYSDYTSNLFKYGYYRAYTRWRAMSEIGPSLDYLASNYRVTQNDITCPNGKDCERTYEICGTCVHDHFIGNIMYAFWMKLFDFKETTTYAAGHGFQFVGPSDDGSYKGALQPDLPYDQAGYALGFALYNSNMAITPTSVCSIISGLQEFKDANNTGKDYSKCQKCPLSLP